MWCASSSFSPAKVDPLVQSRRPGHLGGPWAWPVSSATGKESKFHPSLSTTIPLPYPGQPGEAGQLKALGWTDPDASPALPRPAVWPWESHCISLSPGVHIHQMGSEQQSLWDCAEGRRPRSGRWYHQWGLTHHCLHQGFQRRRGHPLPQPPLPWPVERCGQGWVPPPPAATWCRCREMHSPMAGHPEGYGPGLPLAGRKVGTVGDDRRAGPKLRRGTPSGAAGRWPYLQVGPKPTPWVLP